MFRMAINEYWDWLKNPRQSIWLVIIVVIYQYITNPLVINAEMMNCNIGIFEPYIVLSNDELMQMIIPVFFLLLISDFPGRYGTSYNSIIRIGRDKWLTAQILFLLMCSITFSVMVVIASIATAIGHIGLYGEWSRVITDFVKEFPQQSANAGALLLDESTYFQGRALGVFGWSVTFMSLNVIFLGMILIWSYCIGINKAGMVTCIVLEVVGFMLCKADNMIKWVFPNAHSVYSFHFTKYYSEPVFPIVFSGVYFIAIIAITYIFSYVRIKKIRLTGEG